MISGSDPSVDLVESKKVLPVVIKFVNSVDDFFYHYFVRSPQEKIAILKELAGRRTESVDELKEDEVMELYLRGKLVVVSTGYSRKTEHYYSEKTEKNLKEVLQLNRYIVDAWIWLGTCVWKRGEPDKAKSCYRFGLEQDLKYKELLRLISVLERRQCFAEVENPGETIGESIKHAREAVALDVQDGISWYALGNACLSAYFMGKDEKMMFAAELRYNCSLTYKFLENYWMALSGFESAGLMDPSLKAIEQALNLRDVLDDIGSLLKDLNDAKQLPSPILSLPTVDFLASPLASVELDPLYARATVDRLTEGLNEVKTVTGKVLFSVENPNERPIYYVVCDSDCTRFVITVYGVCSTVPRQFKSVRVNFLRQFCVDSAIVSPQHVIHRSDLMKG